MMIFLKLGGSLITDKTGVEAARPAVLARLAAEIAAARAAQPGLPLLIGHGGRFIRPRGRRGLWHAAGRADER